MERGFDIVVIHLGITHQMAWVVLLTQLKVEVIWVQTRIDINKMKKTSKMTLVVKEIFPSNNLTQKTTN